MSSEEKNQYSRAKKEEEPAILGQCRVCTRIVRSSTWYCKNCYWQCEQCKQIHQRLRERRRFYNGRILCDNCYRDDTEVETVFRV